MTAFIKENFSWDGMYLMYEGDQGEYTKRYEDDGRTHPSRIGSVKPMFIARFKYGSKPWKTFVNTITKHYTVEQVVEKYAAGESPVGLMQATGWVSHEEKKLCRKYGTAETRQGVDEAWEKELVAIRGAA